MRVFRFRDPTEPAHTKQEQDIVCEIYLEESESTYEEKQCECYTPDECVPFTQPETTQITASSTQSQAETSSITTTQITTTPSSPSPGSIGIKLVFYEKLDSLNSKLLTGNVIKNYLNLT